VLVQESHGPALIVLVDGRIDPALFAEALVVRPGPAHRGGGVLGVAVPLGERLQIVGLELVIVVALVQHPRHQAVDHGAQVGHAERRGLDRVVADALRHAIGIPLGVHAELGRREAEPGPVGALRDPLVEGLELVFGGLGVDDGTVSPVDGPGVPDPHVPLRRHAVTGLCRVVEAGTPHRGSRVAPASHEVGIPDGIHGKDEVRALIVR
jgi:hypothetical protein